MAAIREGRTKCPLRLYPTVSSSGTSRICRIVVFSVLTLFIIELSIGLTPYSPIPNRTISNCAPGKRSIPAELQIWRSILCGNASCNCMDAFSNISICLRVKASNCGASLPTKWENTERGMTAFCPFRRSISRGISSGANPNRCIPVSSFT